MEDEVRSLRVAKDALKPRNGKTWLAVGGLGIALLTFLSGFWTGQRTAWTDAGSQAEKIRQLEATVQSQAVYLRDLDNQVTRFAGVAAQAERESDKARDDVKELRQIIYNRGWGR